MRHNVDTYLVTGASSGIGYAVAVALLERGHRVMGLGRDQARLNIAHPAFRPVSCNLADLDALPERLAALHSELSRIKGVVLCAGAGRFGSLEEFSYAQIRELVDLNVTAQMYLARTVLPTFKARGAGDLILIGSQAALAGGRRGTVYTATKFAIRGFCQALRQEASASGVRVALINPGMVDTAFFDELDFAPGESPENHLRADDVAAAVCAVLDMPPGTVVDEINLSPLKKVIRRKPRPDTL